jgi:lactoylglutathione lyase
VGALARDFDQPKLRRQRGLAFYMGCCANRRKDHLTCATHDGRSLSAFDTVEANAPPGADHEPLPASAAKVLPATVTHGLVHLGFALRTADAVDVLSGVVAAAGHRVLEQPHRTGQLGRYESVVLDPDGNRLELTV